LREQVRLARPGAGETCQAGRGGGEIGSNLEREERESARVEERESARVD
jgi:hypothetical protein